MIAANWRTVGSFRFIAGSLLDDRGKIVTTV